MTPDTLADPTPASSTLTSWLKTVLWGAFLLPTVVFLIAAGWGYRQAYERAHEAVLQASSLSLRHAERALQIAEQIGHDVDEAVRGTDEAIRADEFAYHQRLSDMTAGLPSIVNVNVWNALGSPLVRSDLYPSDRNANVADRAYFTEQRDHPVPLGISDVLKGRQSGKEIVNLTIRRSTDDGHFNGVVAVSVSPGFFREYYRSLASERPYLAIFTLVRTDGMFVARMPELQDGRLAVRPDNPVLLRVAAGDPDGFLELQSTDDTPQARLVSFRRIPGYPLYVTAGLPRSAVTAAWLRTLMLLAAIYLPTTLCLIGVSWLALQRARREQLMAQALQEQTSRRAKAEQAMLEAQKFEALSQVTGGVAHDFNNLLTIINTSLHVLKRSTPGLGENRHIDSMTRAIKSGVDLTRQLLSFSRKQALHPETLSLQTWLPKVADLLKSTLGTHVTLSIDVDAATEPVMVDAAELELALINLSLNARHAMPEGGLLRITAANGRHPGDAKQPMVVVRVIDSGDGIAAHVIDRVFEPFFTTKGAGKGTGLGLSQVYGLCTQSGGTANVVSALGRGTTVSLYFPAAEQPVGLPETSRPVVDLQLRGCVMLVEDNDAVAAVTETLLRSAGLEVVRMDNADNALSALEAGRLPDVVLSDISMPGSIDGIGLADAVKSRWPTLPILLTTGYAARIDEAVEAGFRVINKPAAPEVVLKELGDALAAR
ncbi:hybrid sensor histidine kinase/response regulator [soil metagenome]